METGKQFTTIAALSNALTTRETRRRLGGRLFCSVLFGSGSIAISTDVHFLIITLCSQSRGLPTERERERLREIDNCIVQLDFIWCRLLLLLLLKGFANDKMK